MDVIAPLCAIISVITIIVWALVSFACWLDEEPLPLPGTPWSHKKLCMCDGCQKRFIKQERAKFEKRYAHESRAQFEARVTKELKDEYTKQYG